MPAFPHPLTVEDQLLAGNRWRARRELWPQSLFLFGMYAALAAVALLFWLRVDAATVAALVVAVRQHEVDLALLTLALSAAVTRRALLVDALRQRAGAYAALPIWREMQARRDARTRALWILRAGASVVTVLVLFALRDGADAWTLTRSLVWSVFALVLAGVFVPTPRRALSNLEATSARARLAVAPRWLDALSSASLPHLPQWWWQQAGQVWLRGRASTTLAVGLLLAPMEAAAILVPLTLFMLVALVSALDVAHGLAAQLTAVLAARPPQARALWRALLPLHSLLVALVVLFVAALLHLVRAPASWLLIASLGIVLVASVDLLLAIVVRRAPQRLPIARIQVLLIAIAIASALPPLLPLFAAALLYFLARRVLADGAHA